MMSIFGIRKKAKLIIKNALGLEAEQAKSPKTTVQQEDPPVSSISEVHSDPVPETPVVEEKAEPVEAAEAEENVPSDPPVKEESGGPAEEGLPLTLENVQEVLDDYVRPGLQSDGGDITLIKIEDDSIYVQLVGACSTCPSSIMTMKMGVEALLREEFPSLNELIDVTSEQQTDAK